MQAPWVPTQKSLKTLWVKCDAVCCSVLQCGTSVVGVCCSVMYSFTTNCMRMQTQKCDSVCCSVLQYSTSVLQRRILVYDKLYSNANTKRSEPMFNPQTMGRSTATHLTATHLHHPASICCTVVLLQQSATLSPPIHIQLPRNG